MPGLTCTSMRTPAAAPAARVLTAWFLAMRVLTGAVLIAAVTLTASAPAQSAPRFTVVLDAAHGGDDIGGHSSDWMEKNFTLALSVRLRSLLAARGIAVVTTRESDTTVDPEHRAEIANHARAQACISLHATLSGSGVHVFASSLAPVAATHFLPWKTSQAAFVTRSVALEGVLNSALQHAGAAVTVGRVSLPVVDSMACPAVAVEIAPERGADRSVNQSPADSLNDAGYQARVADALTAGILEWQSEGGHLDDDRPGGPQP